ncbi:nuclear inhibitor of protein phosphatase 1-like [Lytechinus variegatus]|uniref:nuclear inhibitor of protein phosphatase 1-like n=1 Tax=Lytechinus variegatus TaxID=7654 RepID=UPI001BB114BA|nr:nuclear inhibitor of protein phosphatase 1-like [Lytechinus variegatus]
MANFEVPSWAGKAPAGLHLDVMKEGKMIEKMMVDEKNCYFFGRNSIVCNFVLDHSSCSRVHAALLWHKHLNRSFIVDLGSTHGTFLGSICLEVKKPQQVPVDSVIKFGASSRSYILREKPQTVSVGVKPTDADVLDKNEDEMSTGLLGLPEEENELDNLTEFNTAHNKRIGAIGFDEAQESQRAKRKRRHSHVSFGEEDEVINPEDVDPSIGRFRNLVSVSVIPMKKKKVEDTSGLVGDPSVKTMQGFNYGRNLYDDLPSSATDLDTPISPSSRTPFGSSSTLGLFKPLNLAPDVEQAPPMPTINIAPTPVPVVNIGPVGPKKKKYAKEAWPGKKQAPSLLL